LETYVKDFRNTWMIITGSGILALILSYIFFLFIRMAAGCVVWGFLIMIFLGFALLGLFFYARGAKLEADKLTPAPAPAPGKLMLAEQF